ncbi:MAG: GerMN domain-containing protein [Treponema sp.]|jgi:hypothetical protein|nr:GerMN domain-containing protein [Treponema sp.]
MNAPLGTIIKPISGFFASKITHRVFFIFLLTAAAIVEFYHLGLARRTFVFYNVSDGGIVVEDRMLKRSKSREVDIIRYTEELLLGPVAPDLLPLFPRETRLKSLFYRDGIVYANFTEDAVLPPVEGGRTFENFNTLYDGILRNFSYVRDVRFFINGEIAYFEEFHR